MTTRSSQHDVQVRPVSSATSPTLPVNHPPARLAWTIWGLGAALYLIGFYQRVAPAVMTAELSRDFSLGAAALGNLSAFYFYSYVAMQIPTGILADRWGPRKLLAAGAFIACAGSLAFGLAPNFAVASAGRLLIGGAVAVAFVGMLKLASVWFAPRQFALAAGLALFVGVVGAVFAGVPLRLLVDGFGWRPVMIVSAVVTFGVGIAIWSLVRDDPSEKGYTSYAQTSAAPGGQSMGVVAGIKAVLRYRNSWLLCLAPSGMTGCILTFSGLWGIPFLTTHYQMTTTEAASVCSALLVAWAVGGPVLGALSDRMGKRKPLYVLGSAILLICWGIVILVPGLPIFIVVGLLLIAGFASGSIIIGFAYAKESVPPHLAGTISGITNMGVMLGPMVLQPAVGLMLDLNGSSTMANGLKVYSWSAYRAGFSLMLAMTALALLMLLLSKDTNCRQHE